MADVPERSGILVVALWLHGDEVIGRLTAVRDIEEDPVTVTACRSVDSICEGVRAFVEAFRDASVTPP